LLKTSTLLIFCKELFKSLIFAREEILRIDIKKLTKIITGIKVIIEKLFEIKNKYKIKNKIERKITEFLKTPIIEKECIRRLNKFIWDGPKYLKPRIDGTDNRLEIIFVTDPEKLLQRQASLTSFDASCFVKQL
tara:strand:+ start:115 stop:516 length:402 start_codon:yes stop_codon:yes gene_type:complete